MNGYKHLFDASILGFENLNEEQQTEVLNNFRSNEFSGIFGFIHNKDESPDENIISIAKSINNELYETYVTKCFQKPKPGYDYIAKHLYYDNCDSHHIMMFIICFTNIKEPLNRIVEIGGGYGGFLTLNHGIIPFKKWSIIDLPHILKLIKHNANYYEIDSECYDLYCADTYDSDKLRNCDLVFGTHSLSEFDVETFVAYFNNIVKTSKYLFYAFARFIHPELIFRKQQIIDEYFDVVVEVLSEEDRVMNVLYVNKKHPFR
jgi:hypothetical protein